jgi:hypothetical protein
MSLHPAESLHARCVRSEFARGFGNLSGNLIR